MKRLRNRGETASLNSEVTIALDRLLCLVYPFSVLWNGLKIYASLLLSRAANSGDIVKRFLLVWCIIMLAVLCPWIAAQTFQPDAVRVDPACVADDENFTRFFDVLALGFAGLGFLVVPLLLPAVSSNSWKFADPYTRLRHAGLWASGVFFAVIFLPPQLARVSTFFQPFGLVFFHSLGNLRLEYLACDLQAVPRDYGLFFFLRWSPGPDLMITYWWAQLLVYAVYAAIFVLVYVALVRFAAPRRVEAMGR